jgi:hypothetical protein
MVAHALAAIKNRKFGGLVNPERIALLAMYHLCSETFSVRTLRISGQRLISFRRERWAKK